MSAGPHKGFALLFTSQTISAMSDFMGPAALTLAIVGHDGQSTALGLVLGCGLLAKILVLPGGGVLADRLDPKRVAVAADLLRVGTQAGIGATLLSGSPQFPLIAVLQFIAGGAAGCALPAGWPLMVQLVPKERRQRANALLGTARSVALLSGPGLAGILTLTLGPSAVFALDAVGFAVSAVLLAMVRARPARVPSRIGRPELREGWTEAREGWAEVRARRWYWTTLVAHAAWNFASGVLLTVGPVVVAGSLGGQGVWIVLVQAGGAGLLLGSLLAGRVSVRRPILMGNLGLACYAVPLILLAARASAPLVIVAYASALTLLGLMDPIWDNAVQALVPARALARITAYELVLSLSAQPVGLMLGPAVAAAAGTALPLFAASVVVSVTCVVAALIPENRRVVLP
ncbi:MFS transporter [Nonomuraea sp. NPDC049129]|uniref:MFS transporter n=1 Tax=Nonomuraea sp. NPDC049129 TaxID=3155272 RepID=UPI0033D84E15